MIFFSYANARNEIQKIVPDTSTDHKATSATDFPFRAFMEQLHRIADQLSKDIESEPSFSSVISLCPHAIE